MIDAIDDLVTKMSPDTCPFEEGPGFLHDFLFRNSDLLIRNHDFLIRTPDFLLKNVDFIIKQGGLNEAQLLGAAVRLSYYND